MKNAKITVSSLGNGSIEQVFEYANHGLFISFPGDYALQGDSHPEMQAIDRTSVNDGAACTGDSHPEMQAIDRSTRPCDCLVVGDSHPEMQAIDRGSSATMSVATVMVTQKCRLLTGTIAVLVVNHLVMVTQKCRPLTGNPLALFD